MQLRICMLILWFTGTCTIAVHGQQKAPGLPEVENLQDFYRTGVGIRVGWPVIALTAKHFIQKRTALEFIAAPQFNGFSLTALAERHHATRHDGLYWYYGLGIDGGVFDGERFEDYGGDHYRYDNVTTIGVAGIIGVEKNIHETPFSIALDLKPRVGVYNSGGSILEGAVSFKYIWSW